MPLPQQISEQEYLDVERLSDVKHEFIDGSVCAMAGASADHGRIAGNLFAAFLRHLQESKSSCESFQADMKVKIGKSFFIPMCLSPVNRKKTTITAMRRCSLLASFSKK
ncbi:MAG: Uma2 family endonuclease [Candidatus Electrothrix sp.]